MAGWKCNNLRLLWGSGDGEILEFLTHITWVMFNRQDDEEDKNPNKIIFSYSLLCQNHKSSWRGEEWCVELRFLLIQNRESTRLHHVYSESSFNDSNIEYSYAYSPYDFLIARGSLTERCLYILYKNVYLNQLRISYESSRNQLCNSLKWDCTSTIFENKPQPIELSRIQCLIFKVSP